MSKEKLKKLFAIGTKKRKDSEDLKTISNLMNTTFQDIENNALGKDLKGVSTNFYDLDVMTKGFQRGSLIVIGGRPSMGKTALITNIAKNVAQFHELPVCFFSLEQSKEQLSYRFLSMEVGIGSGRLKTGRIIDNEWSLVGEGINSLDQIPLFICDKSSIKVKNMFSRCRKIKEKSKNGELGLVVVDYVQMMQGKNKKSRDKELSKIILDLKDMAKTLDVPIILASQISRDIEKRKNKRPLLRDLSETQGLESHADVVIMLYRDEYYNPETDVYPGITELIFSKNRNGPIGTVKLIFENEYGRYRNISG